MFSSKIKILLPALFLYVFCVLSLAQEGDYAAELEYEIIYEIELPRLSVKGFFVNNTAEPVEAEYILKVSASGGTNTAVSEQKGNFNASAMERLLLSESGMNIEESAEYNISLEIKNESEILAVKSLNIKGQEF